MKNHLKKVYNILLGLLSKALYSILKIAPVQFYQPLYGTNKQEITRTCEDRWAAMAPYIDMAPGSVLDIGCNLGYFTFKATEKNKMAMGIDADPFYILACRTIAVARNVSTAYFLRGFFSKELLEKMPSYDIVFNFSVFHHWVKEYGEAEACAMMKTMSNKAKVLFFETGQPDEKGTKWAEKLAFMGEQPKEWIVSFLKECGFSSVDVIGTFATGLTNTDRYLFCAQK